jgi:hypothetical protein
MSHIPNHPSGTARVFNLTVPPHGMDGKTIPFRGAILLTPEPVANEKWSAPDKMAHPNSV